MLDVGAVRAFESAAGLTMDGSSGQTAWSGLLRAVAKGEHNPNGYTYALTSQALPETIKIWHDGRLVLRSTVNTGIPASPTADGTFPVYLRYYFQIMRGTNPDGSQYADPVYYVLLLQRRRRGALLRPGRLWLQTRAWAAWSCPGTPRRRPTRTSPTAAWSPSSARWEAELTRTAGGLERARPEYPGNRRVIQTRACEAACGCPAVRRAW